MNDQIITLTLLNKIPQKKHHLQSVLYLFNDLIGANAPCFLALFIRWLKPTAILKPMAIFMLTAILEKG
jgi:hypothetical protein